MHVVVSTLGGTSWSLPLYSRQQMNAFTNTRLTLATSVFEMRFLYETRTSKMEHRHQFNVHLRLALRLDVIAFRLYLFFYHLLDELKQKHRLLLTPCMMPAKSSLFLQLT